VPRLLIVRERHVPPGRIAEYAAAWGALQASVESGGDHAWSFRAEDGRPVYMEFIELRSADASSAATLFAAAAQPERALENVAAADARGMWKEWKRE
jgi:hypothetical protein